MSDLFKQKGSFSFSYNHDFHNRFPVSGNGTILKTPPSETYNFIGVDWESYDAKITDDFLVIEYEGWREEAEQINKILKEEKIYLPRIKNKKVGLVYIYA